jgi:hypothetical protein
MPCEVVLLKVDFFKMAAVAMETNNNNNNNKKRSKNNKSPNIVWGT